MKLKFILAYNGAKFAGSAPQPNKSGVCNALEEALSHLGIFEKVLFASRTDKGVHASGAVACVKCGEHFKDLAYLKKQINKFSAPYIYIKQISRVSDDFNVRFNAKAREYRYIFSHNDFSVFHSDFMHFYPKFNVSLANEILREFEGEHDFKLFSKQNESKTSVRKMHFARAYAYKNYTIFKFRANGFLRMQIRLSIASILSVIENKISIENLREQIAAKRAFVRKPAPPNALYLSKIIY